MQDRKEIKITLAIYNKNVFHNPSRVVMTLICFDLIGFFCLLELMGNSQSKKTKIKNECNPMEYVATYLIRKSGIKFENIQLDVISIILLYSRYNYACYAHKGEYPMNESQNDHRQQYYKLNTVSNIMNGGYKYISSFHAGNIYVQSIDNSIWNVIQDAKYKPKQEIKFDLKNDDYISVISSSKGPGFRYGTVSRTLYFTKNGKLHEIHLQNHYSNGETLTQKEIHFGNRVALNSVCKIMCGSLHALLLSTKGIVYSYGDNQHGSCGFSKTAIMNENKIYSLQKSFQGNKIKDIAVAQMSNLCLTENGKVYGFGKNDRNQLGLLEWKNMYDCAWKPTLCQYFVDNGLKIRALDTNNGTSAFITDKDVLFTVGNNAFGSIGNGYKPDGNMNVVKEPYQVCNNVEMVCCGMYYIVYMKQNDHNLYCIGTCEHRFYRRGNMDPVVDMERWGLSQNVRIKELLTSGKELLVIVEV